MASKCSGGRELTQLMADHVLNDMHRDVQFAIVYAKRHTDHFWGNRGCARPGLDDGLGSGAGFLHLGEKLLVGERALFETS